MIQKKIVRRSLLNNAIWCLSNLCRNKPAVKQEVIKPALPVINDLLRKLKNGDECLVDVCWMIANLTDASEMNIQVVLDSIDWRPLLKLLDNRIYTKPALRALANISTGGDGSQITNKLVKLGIIGLLAKLLDNPKKSIRKEVLRLLANLTAGIQHQIQVLEALLII